MADDFLKTALTKRLNFPFPVMLAPLGGGPSTPELVAAVSNAGGLASLASAYSSPADIERDISRIKTLTDKPFGINLFAPIPIPTVTEAEIQAAIAATHSFRIELELKEPIVQPPYHEDFQKQFAVILKHRPAVFSFTFGLIDEESITKCRRLGIMTMGTATTVEDAVTLEKTGVDAVIAQGVEAGGHRGLFFPDQEDQLISTENLVKSMTQTLSIPVIASGGIMNGYGIAKVLSLGAAAAHLGTAFLACDEAGTSKAYCDALLNPKRNATKLTRVFSGRPARGLENRFMIEMEKHKNAILPFPIQNAFTRDIRKKATELGRAEYLSLWAGQNVHLIRKMNAAALVQLLCEETIMELKKLF